MLGEFTTSQKPNKKCRSLFVHKRDLKSYNAEKMNGKQENNRLIY